MKNWLIKKLGGFTQDEHNALQIMWDNAIALLQKQDRITILGDNTHTELVRCNTLVVAPQSRAQIMSVYCEHSNLLFSASGYAH